jgi:hypothetical protein
VTPGRDPPCWLATAGAAPIARAAVLFTHEPNRELSRRGAIDARCKARAIRPDRRLGLLRVDGLSAVADDAAVLLGADLPADTGVPWTYPWGARVLGAPGYPIAGDQGLTVRLCSRRQGRRSDAVWTGSA